ncbi:hypothetical protein F183_A49110 [Bryobacterales bacterium F-183]|nr:hypothetical protein F183_A49110 [Bryobacterales bacterium F-183]
MEVNKAGRHHHPGSINNHIPLTWRDVPSNPYDAIPYYPDIGLPGRRSSSVYQLRTTDNQTLGYSTERD